MATLKSVFSDLPYILLNGTGSLQFGWLGTGICGSVGHGGISGQVWTKLRCDSLCSDYQRSWASRDASGFDFAHRRHRVHDLIRSSLTAGLGWIQSVLTDRRSTKSQPICGVCRLLLRNIRVNHKKRVSIVYLRKPPLK